MAIELHIHGYKHRVTNSGLLQSSPVDEDIWFERSKDEMNLTGGDQNLIKNTIVHLSELLPANYVVPKKNVTVDRNFTANKPR